MLLINKLMGNISLLINKMKMLLTNKLMGNTGFKASGLFTLNS